MIKILAFHRVVELAHEIVSTTCCACSVGLLLGRIEAVRRYWDEAGRFKSTSGYTSDDGIATKKPRAIPIHAHGAGSSLPSSWSSAKQ